MGCGCGCGSGGGSKGTIVAGLVGAAVLVGATWYVAGQKGGEGAGERGRAEAVSSAQPEQPEDMMALMMRLATPGEAHKRLDGLVGKWKAVTAFEMEPGADWVEGEGVEENEWVLGGRWVRTSFKMDFMGEPFEGLGFMGYDNGKGEYVSIWMDTMSTAAMVQRGGYDEGEKAFTLEGEFEMGEMKIKSRGVTKMVSEDERVMEFYHDEGEGYRKIGEIRYTRMK